MHSLLSAFRARKPAFGAWVALPGTFNIRTVALASPHLSWLAIDCEHGLTSLHPDAAESIQAVAGTGPDAPSVLVRIPATGTSSAYKPTAYDIDLFESLMMSYFLISWHRVANQVRSGRRGSWRDSPNGQSAIC